MSRATVCVIALPLIYGSLSTNVSRRLSNKLKSKRITGHLANKFVIRWIQCFEAIKMKWNWVFLDHIISKWGQENYEIVDTKKLFWPLSCSEHKIYLFYYNYEFITKTNWRLHLNQVQTYTLLYTVFIRVSSSLLFLFNKIPCKKI